MATRFLARLHDENTSGVATAISNDATGLKILPNLPSAAGIAIDLVDYKVKYNQNGAIVSLLDSAGVVSGAVLTAPTITTSITPTTTDGAALGSATLMFSDLFLASGGVINWNNGDVTITHSANALAFAGTTAAGINGYSFDMAAGAIASEAHGIDVTAAGTMAGGKSLVGLNVAVTPAGSAGVWAAGIYAKVVQSGSKTVNGYIAGAELEVVLADGYALSDNAVLVLNFNSANTQLSNCAHAAYIFLRDYSAGDKINKLFWFGDAAIGSGSATSLVTTSADKNQTHAIKCEVGTTTLWLMATTNTPT